MDSWRSIGLPVAGVSLISALGYYCLSRPVKAKSPRQKRLKKQQENMILFFDESGAKCYSCPDHNISTCLVEQCPLRHLWKIVKIVSEARYTVDVCLYSLTHPDLENAFLNLLKNGKKVRCVFGMRNDEEDRSVKLLRSEGAFVTVKDRHSPATVPSKFVIPYLLMHHKFVIVDNRILITGSMNWTTSSFHANWDHIIISTDKFLVSQFVEEFECLHAGGAGGDEKTYITRPTVGPSLQAIFFRKQSLLCRPDANRKKKCDRPDCMFTVYRAVLHHIVSASVSIDICVQQLTLEDVGNELVLSHDNGIKIRVISDRAYARGTGSQIPYFIKEGIPVHMKSDQETVHHKFIIVDGKTVLSGSLNWTMQSFFGNYENLLVIRDADLVSEFQREFERLWEFFPTANSVRA
ncbi:uncharacterized protein LOC117654277 isoform X2 [Thrips palmi]|uniref:Mitochondrial cardiolipin hydrolase n=1 Tax=Thrips palmi TaxID=161013 RepID=A0A6P9AGT9_THRPL|nr:uncharacterized protein LOC117654277 isoform X2 [Thrips palmi]